MVKFDSPTLDATFAALADPTRRQIVARLAERNDRSVNDLAEPLLDRMSLPGVRKHLRVLERAGLLTQHREGRVRRCRLEAEPLRNAYDWVGRYRAFWSGQLDALADYLEREGGFVDPPQPN